MWYINYCISLGGRGAGSMDALAMRGRVHGLRRFWLTRGENKDHRHHTDADERANLLTQVHIITILSSLSSSLRSFVDDTQHTTHKSLLFSAFISRSFIFVSVPNPHQMCTSDGHAAPACLRRYFGCLLNAGNKHGHAKKTHKSKHNMPLLVDMAASITAGFCRSHFLCDLYTRCLCLVYPIIIHTTTRAYYTFSAAGTATNV